MSRAHKKYIREEKAKYDKVQTIFGEKGKVRHRPEYTVESGFTLDVSMKVHCPFCLYDDKLQAFLVSTKKGLSQSRAKCPICNNGMLMRSLTAEMTPEEYAQWCFEYSGSGFWQKVPFNTWKERLFKMGWAYRFWSMYKELKGDSGKETYADHMEQAAKEWAVEQGYMEE